MEWHEPTASPEHIRREREKARSLRATEWWKAILRQGVCRYCGRRVGAAALTMDHAIPVARGGKSTKANCVPCCRDCNAKKGMATPAERILERLAHGG